MIDSQIANDFSCVFSFLVILILFVYGIFFFSFFYFSGDLLPEFFFSHAFFHGSFYLFCQQKNDLYFGYSFFVFLNLENVIYCHFCVFFLVMEMVKILPKTVKMILMKTVKMILTKIHDYTFFCYGFSSLQKQTYCNSIFSSPLS